MPGKTKVLDEGGSDDRITPKKPSKTTKENPGFLLWLFIFLLENPWKSTIWGIYRDYDGICVFLRDPLSKSKKSHRILPRKMNKIAETWENYKSKDLDLS